LKWFGHVTRSSGLANIYRVLFREGDEEADRGKEEDNITEWTGKRLREVLRKAETEKDGEV